MSDHGSAQHLAGPFAASRAVLGLEGESTNLKKAYRRKVAEHPPETDPEGFRQIRAAYELLSDPLAAARAGLEERWPLVAPPRPRGQPGARGELMQAILRDVARGLETGGLVSSAGDEAP